MAKKIIKKKVASKSEQRRRAAREEESHVLTYKQMDEICKKYHLEGFIIIATNGSFVETRISTGDPAIFPRFEKAVELLAMKYKALHGPSGILSEFKKK